MMIRGIKRRIEIRREKRKKEEVWKLCRNEIDRITESLRIVESSSGRKFDKRWNDGKRGWKLHALQIENHGDLT